MLFVAIVFWCLVLLIFHVYLLYPVGIYLRAALCPANHRMSWVDEPVPFLTVLIPAHNEERWIARKVENALALDYPRERMQILVASDGSTDRTVEIVRRYSGQGVELAHHPQRSGKTATLNRVVPAARGEIILLTDANALLSPDAARQLVRHFRDPGVGCVSGERVCLHSGSPASEGEGLYWRYEAWIKTSESRLGSCLGGTGQVMAVRKSLFPHIPAIGDDFYVPMKILLATGSRALFEPKARAEIPAAATLKLELERKIRSHVSLLRDMPHLAAGLNPLSSRVWWGFLSHHVLRLFVPFALMAAFTLNLFLWGLGRFYQSVFLAQCLAYLAAGMGLILARRQIRLRPFYVPFYFLLANFAVLLAWVRWLRGRHQYAWQRTDRVLPSLEPAKERARLGSQTS